MTEDSRKAESTHTEGPWVFEAENGKRHPRVYGRDNSLIAEVGNANLMRWEEWDPNARLIAAAPDLLAALRETVEFLEIAAKRQDPDWDGTATPVSVLGQARAAIRRATKNAGADR